MTRRKRDHIPLRELLASALADKLPQAERDRLRADRVSARVINAMFTADHVVLHSFGGPDSWWNLDMRRRGPELAAKDRADTSRAAKVVRLDDKWADFMRRIRSGKKPYGKKPWGYHTRGRKWPSNPIGGRK